MIICICLFIQTCMHGSIRLYAWLPVCHLLSPSEDWWSSWIACEEPCMPIYCHLQVCFLFFCFHSWKINSSIFIKLLWTRPGVIPFNFKEFLADEGIPSQLMHLIAINCVPRSSFFAHDI